MIGKLLKYELKATGRILLPLYLLLLVFSAGLGFSIRQNEFIEQATEGPTVILLAVFGVLFVSASIVTSVMTLVLILQRFYRNLLGNEGYLMFNLPVSVGEHILGKSLSALFWVLASVLVGVGCSVILFSFIGDIPEVAKNTKTFWDYLLNNNTKSAILRSALLIFVFVLVDILKQVEQVYASIAIGHLWTSHRLAGSFLAYIVISILEGLLLSPLQKLFPAFTEVKVQEMAPGITVRFTTGDYVQLLASLALMLLYGFTAWYLLKNRLNLE